MKTMDNLVKGDKLICIDPNLSTLSQGHTYIFNSYYKHDDGTFDRGCIYVEGHSWWLDYDSFKPLQKKTSQPKKNKTLKRSDLNALVRKGIEITIFMMAKSEDGDFDPMVLSKKLVDEFLNK